MNSISTSNDDGSVVIAPVPAGRHAWCRAMTRTTALLRKVEPYGRSALLLALRLTYGWFFAMTGWGKLANIERTAGFFETLGMPEPAFMAALVGLTELTGGVLFAAGFGTRIAAAALSVVMLTAYATAHAAEAFTSLAAFTEQEPYPYLVATLVVLAFGAGRVSIDHLLGLLVGKRRASVIEE